MILNKQVYYFVQVDLPEENSCEEIIQVIEHLAKVGLDINDYENAFKTINDQSLTV